MVPICHINFVSYSTPSFNKFDKGINYFIQSKLSINIAHNGEIKLFITEVANGIKLLITPVKILTS